MNIKRNEVSYYPAITTFIETQIKSNFRAKNIFNINIFWMIGELTSNVRRLIKEHPIECACLNTYIQKSPPLNLDVFGVITNGEKFEFIIIEVKQVRGVGLSEWSQLLGYCVVSDAKYGLLINIDAGASNRLSSLLAVDQDISKLLRIKRNEECIEHYLGFMQWNSLTKNFEYSNLGQLWSVSKLSDHLIDDFTSN
jgi:hypothetical protein